MTTISFGARVIPAQALTYDIGYDLDDRQFIVRRNNTEVARLSTKASEELLAEIQRAVGKTRE